MRPCVRSLARYLLSYLSSRARAMRVCSGRWAMAQRRPRREAVAGSRLSCMQGSLSELGICGAECALRAGRSRNLSRGFCSERGNNKGAERTLSIRIAQNEMRLQLRASSTHLTFLSRPVNIRMHQSREISYSHREYLLTETRPNSCTLTLHSLLMN